MPRPLSGQIIEYASKQRGLTYALRIYCDGRRHYMRLGAAAEGWTRERAERYRQSAVADILAGRWEPPPERSERIRRRRMADLASAARAYEREFKTGPADASRAYEHIRKAARSLDALITETNQKTVRLAAREALSALYVAEDAVGRAIRE